MSRKKAKKMHIKRWKYNHRPKDTAVKVLVRFLNNFDKYMAEAMKLFKKTTDDFFQKLAETDQKVGEGYEEIQKK